MSERETSKKRALALCALLACAAAADEPQYVFTDDDGITHAIPKFITAKDFDAQCAKEGGKVLHHECEPKVPGGKCKSCVFPEDKQ